MPYYNNLTLNNNLTMIVTKNICILTQIYLLCLCLFCANNLVGQLNQGQTTQFPAIWSEEGKYLANVLGDALVQGLTYVSNERPEDPIGFLANFLKSYKNKDGEEIIDHHTAHALANAHAPSAIKMASDNSESENENFFEENTDITQHEYTQEYIEGQESAENPDPEESPENQENFNESDENPPEEDTQEEISGENLENNEENDENQIIEGEKFEENGQENLPESEIEASDIQDQEGGTTEENQENQENDEEELVQELETVETTVEVNSPIIEEVQYEQPPNDLEENTTTSNKNEIFDNENEYVDSPEPDEDPEETAELMKKLEDNFNNQDQDDLEKIQEKEDPEEQEEVIEEGMSQRDERGQSVLHFTASRGGPPHTLLAFLMNPSVNLAWRDEHLRTARDIAKSLGRNENVASIDQWIINTATSGELETLQKLMLDGYKDFYITDSNQISIQQLVDKAEQPAVLLFLKSIDDFKERHEKLLGSIRNGSFEQVKELLKADPRLSIAIGPQCRTSLHVAVLAEEFAIVQYIASRHPEALRRGDNLNRLPLHYAMGLDKVEKMVRILVKCGARRVVKDLKGRNPSFYYVNRDEIKALQNEEAQLRAAQNTSI